MPDGVATSPGSPYEPGFCPACDIGVNACICELEPAAANGDPLTTAVRLKEAQARIAELEWLMRELHEGACSPAYRPPDSDYRLWALELLDRHVTKGQDTDG